MESEPLQWKRECFETCTLMQSLPSVQEQKEALLQQIKERQDRVRAILESAPLQKGQQDFRYDSAGTSHQPR